MSVRTVRAVSSVRCFDERGARGAHGAVFRDTVCSVQFNIDNEGDDDDFLPSVVTLEMVKLHRFVPCMTLKQPKTMN